MNNEKIENRIEKIEKYTVEAPVNESFLNAEMAKKIWPEEIINNKDFIKQTELRKKQVKAINNLFDAIPRPDMSIENAIKKGIISEKQAESYYDSLIGILSDPDYKRLVLYLPFESLPKKNNLVESGPGYTTKKFRGAYMTAWKNLLGIHDVRANFVNGDVLEIDERENDLERVVKAAHLIPKLIEKEMINVDEVIKLIENSNDEILRHSIADALSVMADLGQINTKEIKQMEDSEDNLVSNMAKIIKSNMEANNRAINKFTKSAIFSQVQKKLDKKFIQIKNEDYGDITNKRKNWLIEKKEKEAINSLGKNIALSIYNDLITDEEKKYFLTSEASVDSQRAMINGIRQSVEMLAVKDLKKAKELYKNNSDILKKLFQKNDIQLNKSLIKTWRRLYHLGVVEADELEEKNIIIPNLSGDFSHNLENMKEEIQEIKSMVEKIKINPELSKILYPVILQFGSRLKGYGDKDADIDLAVFIKPGIDESERENLQKLLKETFLHDKIKGEMVEFWLEKNDDKLKIHDFNDSDVRLGESSWTHILFGAVWEGDEKEIRKLQQKLLPPYIHETDKKIKGHNARDLYLEELERDILQYRLMHKGYEKFYPNYGGIYTLHADDIDSKSMFWDSGYRRLATRLFAGKVFLPKLKK